MLAPAGVTSAVFYMGIFAEFSLEVILEAMCFSRVFFSITVV